MSAARVLSFPPVPPTLVERSHLEAALATVDAALAVLEADDRTRWTEVLRRFRNFVLWHRAAVIDGGAWQMEAADSWLRPVAPRDPVLTLASRLETDGVCWIDAGAEPVFPAGIRGALVARHRRVTLYFEMGLEREAPRRIEQQLVLHVLALLAALGCGTSRDDAAPSHGLVGDSEPMRKLFELLQRQADARAPVYIYGETGTGKERVARALHDGSSRRAAPFVAVNASAVSEGVFESELFGHVRGAFTGAAADREGYVACAHGGTLFLDEIADLGASGQAKLLRFLDGGEYRRVGESRSRHADVRVVAASNVPLERRVACGSFRADLFYRLQVLALHLPPLRARHGDLAPLARHLLKEAAEAERKTMPRLSDSACAALERYHWPGNVRELRGEMQRLAVEHPGEIVRAADLSAGIRSEGKSAGTATLAAATAEFERTYIERALAECRGARSMAARRLGISRQGLLGKMKRLRIA